MILSSPQNISAYQVDIPFNFLDSNVYAYFTVTVQLAAFNTLYINETANIPIAPNARNIQDSPVSVVRYEPGMFP
jgi:hypothetical protein